jgi:hypothetical protein
MVDENLVKAVKEVRRSSHQAVVADACDRALREGTDESLRKALITTRESANTWVAKGIANRALGYEDK